jgi:type IV pilus assembly protein PilW
MKATVNRRGFTLIELLVTMAIASVVLAAVGSSFQTQLKSYVTQQTVVDMQQNARGGMYLISREIRLAGYDPTGKADAGFHLARSDQVRFSMDLNKDGDIDDPGELIEYRLHNGNLERSDVNSGTGFQIAALNVDALDFVFLDKDGNLIDDDADPADYPHSVTFGLPSIRFVQVSLLTRAGRDVPVLTYKYLDTRSYENQQGDIILAAPNDKFRRIYLTTVIRCRNLGLQ